MPVVFCIVAVSLDVCVVQRLYHTCFAEEICGVMGWPVTDEWANAAKSHKMVIKSLKRTRLAKMCGNGMHIPCAAAVLIIAALFVKIH